MTVSCELCIHWNPTRVCDKKGVPKYPPEFVKSGDYVLGKCRRYPPQIVLFGTKKSYSFDQRFPETWNTDLCGEFSRPQQTTKPDHLNADDLKRQQGIAEPK